MNADNRLFFALFSTIGPRNEVHGVANVFEKSRFVLRDASFPVDVQI